MKSAGWLFFLLFPMAQAQAPGQNGIRAGGETVYLVEHNGPPDEPAAQVNAIRARAVGRPVAPFAPGPPAPRADFETWVEGIDREYSESISTGPSAVQREPGKATVERWVRDNFRHLYIHYRLVIEMLPQNGTYRATFADAQTAAPRLEEGWRVLTPHYPAPQILQDGDTIPLDLYVSDASAQKLVDYIHFGEQAPVLRRDPPRDVYTDAPEFDISQPRLRVNGVAQDLQIPPAPIHGQDLWIYIPDAGRFDLSFKAGSGFDLAGESLGSSLIFASGRDLLRLDGSERIAAAGSAPYRLYIKRSPEWTPTDGVRPVQALIGVQ